MPQEKWETSAGHAMLFLSATCAGKKKWPPQQVARVMPRVFLFAGLLAPVDGSELGVSANLFLRSPQPLAPEFALQKRAFSEFWKPLDFVVITL